MAFGNIVAISQRNVKRMLAYSSIAHTGYMLVGLAAYQRDRAGSPAPDGSIGDRGVSSLLYYMLAYTFMNIGAFAVVDLAAAPRPRHDARRLRRAGLDAQPLAAAAMTVFMVSLMGVPPLLGFYAKYYVILAAIDADLLWLAIAVVLALGGQRLLLPAGRRGDVLQRSRSGRCGRRTTPLLNVGIVGMVVANLVLGLFSERMVDLADKWQGALTQVARVSGGG